MTITIERGLPSAEVIVAVPELARRWSNETGLWHELVGVVEVDEWIVWELKPVPGWPDDVPFPAP